MEVHDDTMEERRSEVFAKLESQYAAREAEKARRAAIGADEKDPTQNSTVFWQSFERALGRFKPDIDKFRSSCRVTGVSEVDRPNIEAKLAGWVANAKELQKMIADATLYLPSYDVRQAQKTVAEVNEAIEGVRTDIMPRKKFSFRTRASKPNPKPKPSASQPASDAAAHDAAGGGGAGGDAATSSEGSGGVVHGSSAEKDSYLKYVPEEHSINSTTGSVLHVTQAVVGDSKDLRLEDLTDCVVVLDAPVRAIRADNLTRCHVYTGAVAGSLLLHNCTDCVFMVSARQIRIHTSVGCDYYLNIKSRPIIEDCKRLRFAPYALDFDGLDQQLMDSGLPAVGSSDMWSNVDDFHWHRVQQSPNWSVVPPEERITAPKTDLVRVRTTEEGASASPAPPAASPPASSSAPASAPAPPPGEAIASADADAGGGGTHDDGSSDDEL